MNAADIIAVAAGLAPADVVLKNARIVNVFTCGIESGNVAVAGGCIAGIGDYTEGREVVDLAGRYLIPGLIDGHIHIESSMLHPVEYARAVVPRGVLGVVTDLHEMANVAGMRGLRAMMRWCRGLPCDFFFMLPSCVPASHLETSGATLGQSELRQARQWQNVVGLGEMMDFPGVVQGAPDVMQKLGLFRGGVVDGHAPGLSGRDLQAYVASGIRSDHESIGLEEAREKLARGMHVMIREGSSEKNLEALLPLVDEGNSRRFLFVVDDRSCVDLLADGDVDAVVRRAISLGLDPVRAVQMATLNPAEYFRLWRYGAVAPGYFANFAAMPDLRQMKADMVFHGGRMVARDGGMVVPLPSTRSRSLRGTVHVKPFSEAGLAIRAKKDVFPAIQVVPGQIVTRKIHEKVRAVDGQVLIDVSRDLLKLVVVERHRASGNIGAGLVKGFGLTRGALCSTVAHDSHNIVCVGCSDADISFGIRTLERLGGGLAVVKEGEVLSAMPLPVGGLLSDRPLGIAARQFTQVEAAAAVLGCRLGAPFAVLSFLALPVIPELKLTDLGLVDVAEFRLLGTDEL